MGQIINVYQETNAEYNLSKTSRQIKKFGPGVDKSTLVYTLMRCTIKWFQLAIDMSNADRKEEGDTFPDFKEHEYFMSDYVEKMVSMGLWQDKVEKTCLQILPL